MKSKLAKRRAKYTSFKENPARSPQRKNQGSHQLPLVSKLLSVDCLVLKYGTRPITMPYYFCKTCDKDYKTIVCMECMKRCHRGHQSSELFNKTRLDQVVCMCGIQCHNLVTELKKNDIKLNFCNFFLLNLAGDNIEYYQNENKVIICTFCNNFCREHNLEEEEFEMEFHKVKLTRKEFIDKIKSKSISCQCPKLPGSKHKSREHFSDFIAKFNHTSHAYYPNLDPSQLLNRLVRIPELFREVFTSFQKDFERGEILKGIDNSNVVRDFGILIQNIENCTNHYFNDKIRLFFVPEQVKNLLLTKFNPDTQNLTVDLYRYFSIILKGYRLVHLHSFFIAIPNFSFFDIMNFSPFQRIIYSLNCKEIDKGDNNIISTIIDSFGYLIRSRPNYFISAQLLQEIFLIIKFHSERYLLNPKEISDFMQLLENCFTSIIFNFSKDALSEETFYNIEHRKTKINIMNSIYEILMHCSYYYNDLNVMNLQNKKSALFIHADNDLGRIILKNLVHLLNYILEELTLFEEHEKQPKNDHNLTMLRRAFDINYTDKHFKNDLIDMVNKTEMLFFIAIQEEDIYVFLFKRCFSSYLEHYLLFCKDETDISIGDPDNNNNFYVYIISEIKRLEKEYKTFFVEKKSINELLGKVTDSIKTCLDKMIPNPKQFDDELTFLFEASDIDDSVKISKRGNLSTNRKKIALHKKQSHKSVKEARYALRSGDLNHNAAERSGRSALNVEGIKLSRNKTNLNSISNLDSPVRSKKRNLSQRLGNDMKKQTLRTEDANNISRDQQIDKYDNCYKLLLGKTNYVFTILKIFSFSPDKSHLTLQFCQLVFELLYAFSSNNYENTVMSLTSPSLEQLSRLPTQYLHLSLEFIETSLQTLIKEKTEIGSIDEILKYAHKIYRITSTISPKDNFKSSQNSSLSLLKFIQIMLDGYDMKVYDIHKFITSVKKIIEDLSKNQMIQKYKTYLELIRTDYLENKEKYLENKDFNNKEIFSKVYELLASTKEEFFNEDIAFEIFMKFIQLINKTFDGNALSKIPRFIYTFLQPEEIKKILTIQTLNIELRLELLTFFRMAYIDMLIDIEHLPNYKNEFQKDLDAKAKELGNSLISADKLRILIFLEMLIKASNPNFNAEHSQTENEILLNELENIKNIIEFSKPPKEQNQYLEYLEKGVLLTVKIHLNKLFSIIMSINGRDFIQIYKFCFHILSMKRYLIKQQFLKTNSNMSKVFFSFKTKTRKDTQKLKFTIEESQLQNDISTYSINPRTNLEQEREPEEEEEEEDEDIEGEPVYRYDSDLIEVESDLKMITSPNFQPLNYMVIFDLIGKHIKSLTKNPTSKELLLYLNDIEEFDQAKIYTFKEYLSNKGIKFSEKKVLLNNLWSLYKFYKKQKENFKNSSICSILDENYNENDDTFRTVVLKFLFYLSSQNLGVYSDKSLHIILDLLRAETNKTQKSIWEIIIKTTSAQKVLIPFHHQNTKVEGPKKGSKIMKTDNLFLTKDRTDLENEDNDKPVLLMDFRYIAEKGFQFILSSIFSQYNPTSGQLSDDYHNACHIIKLFKFLCEEHNNNFQTIFLKKVFFPINEVQKITFYDLMLFVLDKIITLSKWEKVKNEEEVDDYYLGLFSCIIEMLIEIVQGTDRINFDNLIKTRNDNKTRFFRSVFDHNDKDPIMFENGKALRSFLNNLKELMFNDDSDSETIFSIRKSLVEFLLAFLEEYNCPREIKEIIMSTYHPSHFIRSILIVMKKYYIGIRDRKFGRAKSADCFLFEMTENKTRLLNNTSINTVKSIQNERRLSRLKKLDIIRDVKLTTQHKKRSDKKIKLFKFNEKIYNEFNELYFNNDEFCNTQAFDLCSSFYTFLNLTLTELENNETISFFNKINSISKEALDDFNMRTNNSHINNMQKQQLRDDFEFEAYYIIKFFSQISKTVLVKVHPNRPPIHVIFILLPYMNYLSTDTKNDFVKNVNRKNRNTKLIDLMEQSEFFKLEIEYNWNNLRNNPILRKLSEINYHVIGEILFPFVVIINLLLLFSLKEERGEIKSVSEIMTLVYILSVTLCLICIGCIMLWFFTKKKILYQIEKAKYKEKNKAMNKKKLINKPNYLRDDKDICTWDKFNIYTNTIFNKGELTPFFFYITCTILAISHINLRFFHSITLLSAALLNGTLKSLIMSIFVKGRQFIWTFVFTFVLLLVFAGWGFFFQRDRFYDTVNRDKPDHMGESLLYCYLTQINNGLRWHLGIGKVLRTESGLLHLGPFIHRWFYDFVFFVINYMVMLRIVFGIVLDSFRELRKKHYNIVKDMSNKCFICNLEKDICEKNNKSFKEHCEIEHNLWDYANYMILLRMQDPHDLNAVKSRCQSLIFDKNTSWLPDAEGEIDEDELDLFEKKYYKVNTEKTGPSGNEEDDFKQNKFYENSIIKEEPSCDLETDSPKAMSMEVVDEGI